MVDWDGGELSADARECWGKYRSEGGEDEWMPLHRHLADTALVAERLWDSWVPPHVKSVISGSLDDRQARTLLVWLAASHDLGKATPVFAGQVPEMRNRMSSEGFRFGGPDSSPRIPHSVQSHLILHDWLVERGFTSEAADALACVPGGHHGVAPDVIKLKGGASVFNRGDEGWLAVQRELADWVARHAGIGPILPALSARPPFPQSQVLLTAVIIVADWIASDRSRFPFRVVGCPADRLDNAWSTLQLPEPWRPHPPAGDDELFAARFDLPAGAQMRPVQLAAARAARAASGPELLIVEAPMGEGKTEAALMAAEIQAERHGLGGCFVALPTMATSDAMFRRVNEWVSRLDAGRTSIHLAHGKAALNDDFQGLVRLGRLSSVGDPADEGRKVKDGCGTDIAIAHEWLSGRKKGVLANFVVGTIDQILFSSLRSRHLVLRHLAVAGKVVVIDEVHSSDDYMAVFLKKALYWLAAYQVPTVLLSATLSAERRRELGDAYARGLRVIEGGKVGGWRRRVRQVGVVAEPADGSPDAPMLDYPLLTTVGHSRSSTIPVAASGRALSVALETLPDDEASLVGLVGRAQVGGGVVAIVRNTVRRAQQTAVLLRDAFPDVEVVLAHSRFLAVDRAAKERELRDRLGPPPADRPTRMIVVGTQVLEQSLDIDFDLLITDLAPLDLVLQRMGRLHRHARPGPSRGAMAQPRCVLVGVDDWNAEPPEFDRGSEAVYGRAKLLRSAAVLRPQATQMRAIGLPADIPALVHDATRADVAIPSTWRSAFEDAEHQSALDQEALVSGANTFVLGDVPGGCLIGWATLGGDSDAEGPKGRARVRYGDDGLEVLVAQRVGERTLVLPWIEGAGDRELFPEAEPEPWVAKAVATCSLRLPRQLTHPGIVDRVIAELEENGRVAWQQSKWLRGELLLFLDENFTAEVAGHRLSYGRDTGLDVEPARG